jgi:hypothetical protein
MTDRAYAKLIDGADPGKGDGGTDARRSRSCSLKLGDVARCSERSQRRIESEFGIVSSARSKNAPEEISASETNVNAGALGDMSARTAVAPTSRSRVHAAMIENAASTALSFDFMTSPLSTNRRGRHQHGFYSCLVNYSQSVVFWTTDGYGPEKRAPRSMRYLIFRRLFAISGEMPLPLNSTGGGVNL